MGEAEPTLLKDRLNKAAVKGMGEGLAETCGDFDRRRFVREANRGLEQLELKQRVAQLIEALHVSLPQPFPKASAVLVRASQAALAAGESHVLRGFVAWPLTDYIGVHGLEDPERSMAALRELTLLWSAEFAVRPFLVQHERSTLQELRRWTRDPNQHVRRLVSEGTRPRLPWGMRLRAFQRDPAPTLRLLEKLRDDPSEYVRRSVANHLGDVAKDHPELALDVCERWSKGASTERAWLIRHGLRGPVKAGNPRAMRLMGCDPDVKVAVSGLSLSARRVCVGDTLEFSFELRCREPAATELTVDYAVHHVKKNGQRTAKVFKLRRLRMQPSERASLSKRHPIRVISTRVYYPGRHTVEVLVNGAARARADFELVVTPG